jgi:hypothetical protein
MHARGYHDAAVMLGRYKPWEDLLGVLNIIEDEQPGTVRT